ncbi:MAG: LysE family transporter [Candidatus Thorarchaeota archaeon]
MGVVEVFIVLAGWFGLSLTGALAPGPLSAAVVQQASKRGRLHGILPMLGHSLVELVIVIAIILGVNSAALDPYTDILMGVGGFIIILFGLVALRDNKQEEVGSSIASRQEITASSAIEATTQGALVSIFSPYFLLWWIAAGFTAITYLLESVEWNLGAVIIAGTLIYFTHISTDFLFGAFLSVGATYGSQKAQVDSKAGRLNLLNIGIGLFQVALGVFFIWLALPGLLLGTS